MNAPSNGKQNYKFTVCSLGFDELPEFFLDFISLGLVAWIALQVLLLYRERSCPNPQFQFLKKSHLECVLFCHLLQVDVMEKVSTVRVVKDGGHGEPGVQGNQGDQL